jgi:hypothetical protein
MAGQDGLQEVVVLFDGAGAKAELEMRYRDFEALLAHKTTLASHAASLVPAAYAQVGPGLAVWAVVLFRFRVDEEGRVDPAFNLPLAYMAQNAGAGPDLGAGAISMACRSQCPVPWHAINLWEPQGQGDAHPAMVVQKVVWRNRLGLKPVPVAQRGEPVAELKAVAPSQRDVVLELDDALNGRPERQVLEEKLTAAFGEAGRVGVHHVTRQHRDRVAHLASQYREELDRQQQSYLEQIRQCREEIQKLKGALRHEQERNRRLQQLLRGDL